MVFVYYFADNLGGATILTNFNSTYLRTICVQYLRILFSSSGAEDFQKFTLNLLYSNCQWPLIH